MKEFEDVFRKYFSDFQDVIATSKGDWTVKGFIDVYQNIYTISVDTKVISKIIELMLFPILQKFSIERKLKMVLCKEQNHYPDLTFITSEGNKIAVDLKSTYRVGADDVNGMTLGAFTGYFRNRKSTKNTTFPYREYTKNYVLGVIYTRQDEIINENRMYKIGDLKNILSVVKDFEFFLQEKYKIASDRTGSGNTKNIGSAVKIKELVEGKGIFAELGIDVFDDYWMNYLTADMARAIDTKPRYNNLKTYLTYRKKSINKLRKLKK
jgi:hypothetical protein